MSKEEIAERLAHICCAPKSGDSDSMAIQLFVENVVLVNPSKGYSVESMTGHILEYIEYMAEAGSNPQGDEKSNEVEDVVMSKSL